MHGLFPELGPYTTWRLRVSDLHELHVEEAGNPNGKPVIFFHEIIEGTDHEKDIVGQLPVFFKTGGIKHVVQGKGLVGLH